MNKIILLSISMLLLAGCSSAADEQQNQKSESTPQEQSSTEGVKNIVNEPITTDSQSAIDSQFLDTDTTATSSETTSTREPSAPEVTPVAPAPEERVPVDTTQPATVDPTPAPRGTY